MLEFDDGKGRDQGGPGSNANIVDIAHMEFHMRPRASSLV